MTVPAACEPAGVTDPRALASFALRFTKATAQAQIPIPPHTTNGDEGLYADKCGTYTKCLKQAAPGVVDPSAYASFKTALASAKPADFEAVILGGTRKLNGPQGCYTFGLAGTDSGQFGNAPSPANQISQVVVPPAPALASEWYGTELVEEYWAALLRDVAFTDYPTSGLADAAASELSSMPFYQGPRDGTGKVTPRLLFRGGYPGESIGPYVSQFLIQPTDFGPQHIDQMLTTYLPGIDYMTDFGTWQDVQNGIPTGEATQKDPQRRFLHDGRGMTALTRVDELFQEHFTAYLVLNTIGAPPNPGSPYATSKTQQPFGTFGGPDIAATVAEVASLALNIVWYQKWLVHLRHRPESGGGIAHLISTGMGSKIDGTLNANVLNCNAIARVFSKYGTYLLPQSFPEGSPSHPAYPTGHGTVGGACITALKFFYDGNFVIPNPQVPGSNGLRITPYAYTPDDSGLMTVNGELNKLAHNVSFGHGIHAGIHWRSDTDSSIQLGEALAIGYLQDKAQTYNEKFSIKIQKIDGSTATISN